jgi:hypothetical protein
MKSTKERKERRREHQQEKGRHRRHKGERKEEEVRTETPFLSESDDRQSRGFVLRIKKLLDRRV